MDQAAVALSTGEHRAATTPISVILAPTSKLAKEFKEKYSPEYTIECEYGAVVVEGTVFTGAHHQSIGKYARDINPSPCNNPAIPIAEDNSTFLVSHLDLDTIGGIMRALKEYSSVFNDNQSFWSFAEYIDLNGSHKIDYYPDFKGMDDEEISRLKNFLYSFYGWRKNNKMDLESNDDISIITGFFRKAATAIHNILAEDPYHLEYGKDLVFSNTKLNKESYWFTKEIPREKENDPFRVFFRKSSSPTHYLYSHPRDSTRADAIVSWNESSGSITLSYFDSEPTAEIAGPASDVMKTIWGSEAGGHPGCAGTPRGLYCEAGDIEKIFSELVYRISILSASNGNIPF
tara:strand:- start:55 stop:1092 length:1038 start_codon:yes stop_codon:yes gene_type:complete